MARKKQLAKPPRRKPATGAIRFKKGRDLPYEAAFPLGHGQYRYEYFPSRPDATAWLDALVAERDHQDQPRNIAGGSQRVDQFLPAWLETKHKRIKEKTWLGYKYYCELVAGQWRSRRLDSITREDANALILHFHDRGFQDLSQLLAVIKQAFAYALEEEYIRRNPFAKVKAPLIQRREKVILTEAQRAHLLAIAGDDPLRELWHLYSRLGFRRGEGMGLLWGHINEHDRTITIVQQLTQVGSATAKSTPKTPRSTRKVPVPGDIIALLMERKRRQAAQAAADPDWVMTGYVFTNEHGLPLTVHQVWYRWKRLRAAAGISGDMTIHHLRHTADYLLEQQGAPQSSRMALFGHTNIDMDRHYTDHADLDAIRRWVG